MEGDSKTHFSIAITPRRRGRQHSFPCIAPLNLDPYLIILSVKQGSIKYYLFKFFAMTWPGIEPRFPGPLVNTNHYTNGHVTVLLFHSFLFLYFLYILSTLLYIYIYIYIIRINQYTYFFLSFFFSASGTTATENARWYNQSDQHSSKFSST